MNIDIAYTRFEVPLTSEQWQRALSSLPHNLHAKICRFKRWQDRHASLFGKLLLRSLLLQSDYPKDILRHLQYDAYQRPWLKDAIDFNISHAGAYVVCALASHRIGIDIELIKPVRLSDFHRYMTPEQWQDIHSTRDPYPRFYQYWTMKEAVMKADGRGLNIPPLAIQLDEHLAEYEKCTRYLLPIKITDDYPCYLASECPSPSVQLREIGIDAL